MIYKCCSLDFYFRRFSRLNVILHYGSMLNWKHVLLVSVESYLFLHSSCISLLPKVAILVSLPDSFLYFSFKKKKNLAKDYTTHLFPDLGLFL